MKSKSYKRVENNPSTALDCTDNQVWGKVEEQ